MNPETAIALLKAKVKLLAQHIADARQKKPFLGNWDHHFAVFEKTPPTMRQLRLLDRDLETRLRRQCSKTVQKNIRAKLDERFGRSTVGELVEVVAKRVLRRGKVLNQEEAETIEEIADVQIDYGIELLGAKDASRLTGLWQHFARPGP